MKKLRHILLIIAAALILTAISAFAVPQLINYQGKLMDSGGEPVTGQLDMTFALYNGASGGTALWSETQSVAVVNGVFNVALGINNSLSMSVFDNPAVYLGVKVGADPEMTPRVVLLSVPYAMRAGAADDAASLGGFSPASFANSTHGHDADYVNTDGDTMTGGLAATESGSSGSAGAFSINNPSNADNALSGSTGGGGYAVIGYTTGSNSAGAFSIANPSSTASAIFGATNGSGNAVHGYATGTGTAGTFSIANPSSPAYAVLATSDGSGDAVRGYTSGTGSAGSFSVDNPSNGASALYASTNGTGKAGEFAGDVSATGDVTAATFTGNGAGLSNVDAVTLGGSAPTSFANSVAGQSCPEGQTVTGFDPAGGITCALVSSTDLTGVDLGGVDLTGTTLRGANFTNANLELAYLDNADRTNPADVTNAVWNNTTCPDGTNSDSNGGTCEGHLVADCSPSNWVPGASLFNCDFSGETGFRDIDLTGADLRNITLDEASYVYHPNIVFINATMQGAYLGGAYSNFRYSDFRGADLAGAHFSNISLEGSDMSDVDLRQTDMTSVSLYGVNLAGARIEGANISLQSSGLDEANLTNVYFDANQEFLFGYSDMFTTCPDGSAGPCSYFFSYDYNENISNIGPDCPDDLASKASAQRCYLPGADLSGGTYNYIQLYSANLTGANMSNSAFTYAYFNGANLVNATLAGSDLTQADFGKDPRNDRAADLSGADLSGTTCSYTTFTDAVLDGTDFTNVAFGLNVDFGGADLSTAILTGVTWGSSVHCPDGTYSGSNGNTCIGHLTPP